MPAPLKVLTQAEKNAIAAAEAEQRKKLREKEKELKRKQDELNEKKKNRAGAAGYDQKGRPNATEAQRRQNEKEDADKYFFEKQSGHNIG